MVKTTKIIKFSAGLQAREGWLPKKNSHQIFPGVAGGFRRGRRGDMVIASFINSIKGETTRFKSIGGRETVVKRGGLQGHHPI